MALERDDLHNSAGGKRRRPRLFRRFGRNEDGTAAIEFAILAIPFFMLIFATIEACIAYAGEQLLENAVDTMGRKIRTGQITYNQGKTTDMDEGAFRTAFCGEISILLKCDPSLLNLDVRQFTTFAQVPKGIPRVGGAADGDLDTSKFAYNPGGSGSINIVRAYYHWDVTTDLVRPYITNVRGDSDSPQYYLMVATAAFQNEDYP
ncbi:pilus assembly protein [Pseudohoeflea suaedae]|uniref:Pilus assembly protein n=1 Tax=Pseudohoeflea suaedae TaxID=877384 RepID=A0A4R5PLU2_9HYPH|nr:TadE/TadG family type IV pilus assembly protein [Pseudohoeflea suaedae]TDH37920.1 pilus assembly protein [Pseudohoeflea suaedae]